MFEIDLSPLFTVGLELLAGVLLAVGTWAVTRLAAKLDVEGMRELIGADSLSFISIDGLYRAMGEPGRDADAPQFCDACFSGEYPIRLTDQENGNGNSKQLSLLADTA